MLLFSGGLSVWRVCRSNLVHSEYPFPQIRLFHLSPSSLPSYAPTPHFLSLSLPLSPSRTQRCLPKDVLRPPTPELQISGRTRDEPFGQGIQSPFLEKLTHRVSQKKRIKRDEVPVVVVKILSLDVSCPGDLKLGPRC